MHRFRHLSYSLTGPLPLLLPQMAHSGQLVLTTHRQGSKTGWGEELSKTNVRAAWTRANDGTYQIILGSEAMTGQVYLSPSKSNNFFGRLGEVELLAFGAASRTTLEDAKRQPIVRTLTDAF